jgi:hypothetical protein
MKQLPDEEKQSEMIGEIEVAEQKARDMGELAIRFAKKWQHRLHNKQIITQKQPD